MKNAGLISIILFLFVGCSETPVSRWDDTQVEQWFSQSPWSTELSILPDSAIDKRQMAEQILTNPEDWTLALDFLKNSDFKALAPGTYPLSENGTYATVTDYPTKDSAVFEAHRKYIDIQYVARGREYIDIAPLGEVAVYVQDYDPERDIAFFEKTDFVRGMADSTHYWVLFPSDAHRPSLAVTPGDSVRKIVVKIPYHTLRP